jgi:hypothetical protein
MGLWIVGLKFNYYASLVCESVCKSSQSIIKWKKLRILSQAFNQYILDVLDPNFKLYINAEHTSYKIKPFFTLWKIIISIPKHWA